jgi:iron complex outermembrane receptor protein
VIALLLALLFSLLFLAPLRAAPDSTPRPFRLPAGEAAETLKLFAAQAQCEIMFPAEPLAGVRTRPVEGAFAPRAALDRMLAGTGLVVVEDAKTTALMVTRPAATLARLTPANATSPPSSRSENSPAPVKSRTLVSVLAGLLAAATPPLDAQTAPIASGETVALSPFEVKTDRDFGYLATNTLSGTRINSQVKDVGSQISIFTQDFLKDIGATNIEEAAAYALGTQRDFGEEGGEVSAVQAGLKNSTATFRVRGFTGVGRSRNFFAWVGPDIDTSTLERIDFSRGPNSILFGLGNPSGIFNASTKRADVNRNFLRSELRLSNFGQLRGFADANVRSPDRKFAIRVVPLYDHAGTWRKNEFRDRESVFGGATWAVARNTTVRLDFETGRVSELMGRTYTAMDATSFWENAGRPVPAASTYTIETVGGIRTARPTTPVLNSTFTGLQPYANRSGVPAGDYVFVYDGDRNFAANWSVMPTATGRLFTGTPAAYLYDPSNQLSSDPKYVLNRIPRETVLLGSSLPFTQRYHTGTLALEHQLRRDLALEVAFNRALVDRDNYDIAWNFNGLSGDAAALLPTGDPNPNAGRYFLESTTGQNRSFHQGSNGRAALSYNLDLNRKNKWLGRYNLGLLGEIRDVHDRGYSTRETIYEGAPIKGAAVTENRNRVFRRTYVDVNDPATLQIDDYRLTPINGVLDVSRGVNVKAGLIPTGGVSDRRQRTTSRMFVGQAFLLQDYLVATYGRREDKLRQQNFDTVFDTVGELTNVPRAVLNPKRVEYFSGDTLTRGLVLHARPWLSFFYNESSNFNLNAGGARVMSATATGSSLAQVAPNTAGEGKDFGVRLSRLFGGRIFLTYDRFENTGKNVLSGANANLNGFPRNMIFAVYSHNPALLNGTGLAEAFNDVFNTTTNTITQWTASRQTDGHELEITANLTKQWRLLAGYSKSKTRFTGVAPEVAAFVRRHDAFFNRADIAAMRYVNYNATAQLGSGLLGSAGMPAHDTSPVIAAQLTDYQASRASTTTGVAGTASLANTVGEFWAYNNDGLEETIFSRESARPTGEVPEQYHLRTNYRFGAERLKGVSLGGGLRWQAGRVLGTLATRADANGIQRAIPPSQRPTLRGDAVFLTDLNLGYERRVWRGRVNWELQLNISNLLDDRDASVTATFPDGRPRWYRWIEPRRFTLNSSFVF